MIIPTPRKLIIFARLLADRVIPNPHIRSSEDDTLMSWIFNNIIHNI